MIAEEKSVAVEEEKKKATEDEKVEPKKDEIKLTKKMEDVMKTIESMSVLDLSNLVKALEDKFGVSSAVAMAAPLGAAAPGGEQSAGEEKENFSVVLTKTGDKKIQVIKEIRTITSLGLKEAKDLVDAAPKPVKEDVPKEEAEEMKKKLEAVGATVELK